MAVVYSTATLDADIPYATSKKALAATQAELAIVRDELAQSKVVEMPTRAAIEGICAAIAAGRNLEDFENRRQFLQMVARKIEYADNEVRIEGAMRFDAAGAATGGSAEGEPKRIVFAVVAGLLKGLRRVF